eukprot:scaffold127321_cov54-Attheya_sp.AAC.3
MRSSILGLNNSGVNGSITADLRGCASRFASLYLLLRRVEREDEVGGVFMMGWQLGSRKGRMQGIFKSGYWIPLDSVILKGRVGLGCVEMKRMKKERMHRG